MKSVAVYRYHTACVYRYSLYVMYNCLSFVFALPLIYVSSNNCFRRPLDLDQKNGRKFGVNLPSNVSTVSLKARCYYARARLMEPCAIEPFAEQRPAKPRYGVDRVIHLSELAGLQTRKAL
jgi:hypothetical protein